MNYALILSGGTGLRLGAEIPKQYIEVNGKPIIAYCLEKLSKHAMIDGIWIVSDVTWQEQLISWIGQYDVNGKFLGFSKPGENRQLSIWNGLVDLKDLIEAGDCVFIHDAARPLLTETMITSCLEAVEGCDGVLPVLPMKDTVYLSEDGKCVSSLLNRSKIFAGQAPEVFRFQKYYKANESLLPDKILQINGSTEPAIMAGMNIAMIPGDEGNFKITTKVDLERFCEIIERHTE